jgi:hypothetical protein
MYKAIIKHLEKLMNKTKIKRLTGKKFNYSRPGRVWLVTSRLGTGKWLTFFYSVETPPPLQHVILWSRQQTYVAATSHPGAVAATF